MDAEHVLYESIHGKCELSFDQFKGKLSGWNVIDCDGAAVMIKNNEIHCGASLTKRGKWLSRRVIKNIFTPIFNKYGLIQTNVEMENPEGHAFVKRFGFREVMRNDKTVFYELKQECAKYI